MVDQLYTQLRGQSWVIEYYEYGDIKSNMLKGTFQYCTGGRWNFLNFFLFNNTNSFSIPICMNLIYKPILIKLPTNDIIRSSQRSVKVTKFLFSPPILLWIIEHLLSKW